MRTISGYAQLLQRRYGDRLDEQATKYIARTVAGTDRMRRLINDLLAYSRVQTHGGEFIPVDLEDTFHEVLNDLERMVEEHGAKVHAGPLPKIVADPSQMRQILANLINNAIKYCPQDRAPEVSVTAREEQEHWHVYVEDNGTGIPQDQLKRAFEPFQRLVPRTPEDPGTGIGLAISRRIMERHGGRIWAESTKGEGSVFHLRFPKRKQVS